MTPLIAADRISKTWQKHGAEVRALSDVSFTMQAGESVAIAGRSGSGKSTLALCLAGWEAPDSGTLQRAAAVQMIPQDPGMSLNPRWTALALAAEPLLIRGAGTEPAADYLRQCDLPADRFAARPAELSGGQKARVAIARALTAKPSLLILDESLVSLDTPSRAELLRLLLKLRDGQGLALLWILHDLDFAAAAADRIMVMEAGRIVEDQPAVQFAAQSTSPAARALLDGRLPHRWLA